MDIILVVDNMDDFATTSIMFFTSAAAFCKAVTAVGRHNEIINLVKILQEEPCQANNEEEINIQMKYEYLIRSYTISYTILAGFSASGATIGEIFSVLKDELPYRAWVPYDTYSSLLLFLLTCLQEMLALIFGTIVNIGTETLVLGFCLHTCAQLEILKHRLERVVRPDDTGKTCESSLKVALNKTNRLSEHIRYHLCIIRFAEMANEVFKQVLFIQFFGSILILCSTVYYLSYHTTFADFVKLITYTFCMFVQIFVYCWAGNEVILKSTGLRIVPLLLTSSVM